MPGTLLILLVGCATPEPQPEGDLALSEPTVGRVSRAGGRAVWAERSGSGPFTRIVTGDDRTLVQMGAADRPVLSPDGNWVAFVYAPHGYASIGLVPFDGGDPVQLTNVGLRRSKERVGSAPDGFVPVPMDDSLAFLGDRLVWNAPDGPQSVALPGGVAP